MPHDAASTDFINTNWRDAGKTDESRSTDSLWRKAVPQSRQRFVDIGSLLQTAPFRARALLSASISKQLYSLLPEDLDGVSSWRGCPLPEARMITVRRNVEQKCWENYSIRGHSRQRKSGIAFPNLPDSLPFRPCKINQMQPSVARVCHRIVLPLNITTKTSSTSEKLSRRFQPTFTHYTVEVFYKQANAIVYGKQWPPLLTLLSTTQVKTLWERLLSRFMFVAATFLLAAPCLSKRSTLKLISQFKVTPIEVFALSHYINWKINTNGTTCKIEYPSESRSRHIDQKQLFYWTEQLGKHNDNCWMKNLEKELNDILHALHLHLGQILNVNTLFSIFAHLKNSKINKFKSHERWEK